MWVAVLGYPAACLWGMTSGRHALYSWVASSGSIAYTGPIAGAACTEEHEHLEIQGQVRGKLERIWQRGRWLAGC